MINKILSKLGVDTRKPYQKHSKFWQQHVEFESIDNRVSFFESICANKNVIHFGCTDWPIFDPSYNLHVKLSKVANSIHGFDIDEEGIKNLKKYVNQSYFSSFSEVKETYDVCLVPETIEHVDNARTFLENLSTIKANSFYITAPNCFAKIHMERNHYAEDKIIEVVHPDHNCWYSPFTLKNQIEKYSTLKVTEVFLLNNDSMVCCKAEQKEDI